MIKVVRDSERDLGKEYEWLTPPVWNGGEDEEVWWMNYSRRAQPILIHSAQNYLFLIKFPIIYQNVVCIYIQC